MTDYYYDDGIEDFVFVLVVILVGTILFVLALAALSSGNSDKSEKQFGRACNALSGHVVSLDNGETLICISDGKVVLKD